ncbi:MAG: phosphotransferase family protein [Thermoflexales bacterium]
MTGGRPPLDAPLAPRDGEQPDVTALERYLRSAMPVWPANANLLIEQFPNGFSNLTYALRAGDLEWVMRRPPMGAAVRGGHDMAREYRILSALGATGTRAPRPVLLCEDVTVLGAPFYLMERVRGVILRSRLPRGVTLQPEILRRLSEALIDTLAKLHAVDVQTAGLADLGRPEGYVARQVTGWAQRYAAAQTDTLEDMDALAAWLAAHRPPESGAALIHNDFKYDNVVVDPDRPDRIMAILDWEMATIGDPWMDLGTTLGYWSQAGDPEIVRQFNLTHLPGNLDRRGVVARYEQRTGRAVPQPMFYFAFGLYKIGVIIQQIYARYRHGLTRDARFASLIDLERALARMGAEAIARDSL